MKKLGLVLAGGGGKGAYQIGVWKYLKEIGLDKKVSVVSGTSVGALNATLFASVPYEKAEYIWLHEIKDKILKPNNNFSIDLIDVFFNIPTATIYKLISDGIWSRDGLIKIIERYVGFDKLEKTQLKVYATCCKIPFFEKKSFLINDKRPETIKQILCATSAIPIAFKSEKINTNNNSPNFLQDFLPIGDGKYVDGGLVDNIPCSPAIDEGGCSDILVVNLDSKEKSGKYYTDGINYIGITPSEYLGNLFDGTLDFSESGAKHRIELGYDDCKNYYAQLLDDLNSQKNFYIIERPFNLHDYNADDVFLEALKILSENPEKLNSLGVRIHKRKVAVSNLWQTVTEYDNWKIQRNNYLKSLRLVNPQGEECMHGLHIQMVRNLSKLV